MSMLGFYVDKKLKLFLNYRAFEEAHTCDSYATIFPCAH
jgi:hypothetical protein